MTVKKKSTVVKKPKKGDLDPKEVQRLFDSDRKDREKQEREAKQRAAEGKKKSAKRVEQIVKNGLTKVETTGEPIPLEPEPFSATRIEGLKDYRVEGTHLCLLGLEDPDATPTMEQRRAIAQRLLSVGPKLPKYIMTVAPGPKMPKEDLPKPAPSPADFLSKEAKDRIEKEGTPKSPTETQEHSKRIKQRVEEGKPSSTPAQPKKPALDGGIPLKKICSDLNLDPKIARQILRGEKVERPSGRWEWLPAEVDAVKKTLEVKRKEYE